MAKPGSIHKNYRVITVKRTDGTEFTTRSTYHGDVYRTEIDPANHPAWNKDLINFINTKVGQVEGFNTRFAGLNFLDVGKK
ncbi:MAG: ribosomal protein [Candidatus Midichloriaceae bacterium]|jgi:large subunit ribosomal protein L31|nr:ribosomal protein [Candidatus Midichloriaceae bacterium]